MFQHLFAINRDDDDDLHVLFALYVLFVPFVLFALYVLFVLFVLFVLYVLDDQNVDGFYVRDDHHVYVENDELLSEQLVGTV